MRNVQEAPTEMTWEIRPESIQRWNAFVNVVGGEEKAEEMMNAYEGLVARTTSFVGFCGRPDTDDAPHLRPQGADRFALPPFKGGCSPLLSDENLGGLCGRSLRKRCDFLFSIRPVRERTARLSGRAARYSR